MLDKNMVAVLGLVAAVAIMGGALNYSLAQFYSQLQEKDVLETRSEQLEKENKDLRSKLEKVEKELSDAKAAASKLLDKQEKAGPVSGRQGAEPGTTGGSAVTITAGSFSNVKEEKNVVIRSSDELLKLWQEMSVPEPAPDVDFGSSVVIGVFYGEKPNTCYRISIESVKQFLGMDGAVDAVVSVSKTVPSGDTVCAERVTQSYHLVQVPFIPEEVYFTEARG